ncbi:MFS transporter [Vibrio maerlii]|uniref:MFS transporter n=1 Tax=Vibrio maerlii TaxID=2231648 RepID=UPI001F12F087|nr:MFS transporter [Vibrio maerlii]
MQTLPQAELQSKAQLPTNSKSQIVVPVVALSLYAVASGYTMSLIPLMLPHYGLDSSLASWLASVFYVGLLAGSLMVEPIVAKIGHRNAFIGCLVAFIASVAVLPMSGSAMIWLAARFLAGMIVAGIFVTVESWLLDGEASGRAKRVGLYMIALYGGNAIGQLGIGTIGVKGEAPFIAIFSMLALSILVLVFGRSQQPEAAHSESLSLRQIMKLSHAAIIGCIISGLTLGAIYGLMPLELRQRDLSNEYIGGLMALIILGGMAVQFIVPALSKIFGRTLLMALFCFVGGGAIAMTVLFDGSVVLALNLFILGMATFALYPIAISLGCEGLDGKYIVSATQIMLFSYSIGSVSGPVIADWFMQSQQGLMGYLFIFLLATSIYMLFASVKSHRQIMAGE